MVTVLRVVSLFIGLQLGGTWTHHAVSWRGELAIAFRDFFGEQLSLVFEIRLRLLVLV